MDQDVAMNHTSKEDDTSNTHEQIEEVGQKNGGESLNVDPSSDAPPVIDEKPQEIKGDLTTEQQQLPVEADESATDAAEQTTPPPPQQQQQYVNSPSSWQIPPIAFQQQLQQSSQSHEPKPSNSKVSRKRDRLEQRIAENEEDLDAWLSLMGDVQQFDDLDAIRAIYERFLKVYPTSVKHWLTYLELELQYSNFSQAEALFTRCLKTVLSVDLWKFYLGYIRRINTGENGGSTATSESRGVIEKAYEYVLSNVGIDKDAGPIWADYIFFLKSADAKNTWEEQRKMDSMRRVYQKSVSIPLNNVEHLWKEYDQWENNLNRLTAKKFLGEKSAAYMTARTALREARPFTDHLTRNVIPKRPKWTAEEMQQLNLWKRYIKWEKGNPLHLEDKNAVIERVSYAYQQAFLVLRFYPELWYDYAMYYWELSKPERTLALLKQGMEILPTSLLLHFAYAEICESRQMLDEARSAFDSLLEQLDQNVEKLRNSVQQEIQDIQQNAEQERANMNLGDDVDGEIREQLRTRERHIKKKQDALEKDLQEKVDIIMRQCSLVWIAYMRFARRTEGIKSARGLFSKARKSSCRTYHVFIASALMEYHNSKDAGIAGKIFGLGIKSFGDDPDYICEYLDFLIQMNDDNNTRALFERSLAILPPEKTTDVWKKFLDYENKYGGLTSTQGVEKRIYEANPEANHLDIFLSRYSYLDLHPINELHQLEDTGDTLASTAPLSDADVKREEDTVEQNQPANRDSHRLGRTSEPKRPLLESVHPERYARPDLTQWQLFKPSAEPVRAVKNAVPADELKRANMKPTSPPPPFIPLPGVQSSSGSSQVIPAVATTSSQQQQQQQQQSSTEQPTAAATDNLPELISYFVTCLPSSSPYDGPVLSATEFMELLRNTDLPATAPISSASISQTSSSSSGPMPRGGQLGGSGNNNTSARDVPSARGRARGSSSVKRGGTLGRGRGLKRKGGRDEHEDDYQAHKGMGPNRPPDFDVFRARQAKRHREDPPY